MDYKQLGLIVAALTAFIIFYKRVLKRDGDEAHKPAVLIIAALMLAGVAKTNRPFLEKHGGTILSITVCILAVVVIMNIYEPVSDDSPLMQVFRVRGEGGVTKY